MQAKGVALQSSYLSLAMERLFGKVLSFAQHIHHP